MDGRVGHGGFERSFVAEGVVSASGATRHIDPMQLSLAVAFGDFLLMLVSGLLTHTLVFGAETLPSCADVLKVVAAGVLTVVVCGEYQLYEIGTILSGRLRVGRLAFAWLCASGLLVLVLLLFRVLPGLYGRFGAQAADPAAEDRWLVGLLACNYLLLVAGRFCVNRVIAWLSIRRAAATRVAVLGGGGSVQLFLRSLHGQMPMQVVAMVRPDGDMEDDAGCGAPELHGLDELIAKIRRAEVDMVVIALPWSAVAQMREAVRRLSAMPVDIRLAPDLALAHDPDAPVSYIGGMALLNVRDRPVGGWSSVVKKIEDMVVAGGLLLLVSPLMLLVALLIKIDSPGPVLFRQPRYGFNNRLISVLKFRTMHESALDEEGERQAVRDDARVTRVGAVLRRLSIDELPQLLNVLKGEMSMVGPRPHAIATKAGGMLFEDAVDDYMARHQVKPGITGWAQVSGWRGETDTVEKLRKRVECDLHYIHNWSLLFDLAIIALTVRCLVSDRNAY